MVLVYSPGDDGADDDQSWYGGWGAEDIAASSTGAGDGDDADVI